MKYPKLFAIPIILALLFSSCAQSSENSTASATSAAKVSPTTTASTTQVAINYPTNFFDFTKYIGKAASEIVSDDDIAQKRPYLVKICEGYLFDYHGKISAHVDWDYKTILSFSFTPDESITDEERSNLIPKIEELFGHETTEIKGSGYTHFYGNGDYDLALPNSLLFHPSSIFIQWNETLEKQYRELHPYITTASTTSTTQIKKAPSIGMTADEVRNSTWGSPSSINKTTTQNGIHEQWVYRGTSKTKYIYFDNGVVTAIQE